MSDYEGARMIYPYQCPNCNNYVEINCKAEDYDKLKINPPKCECGDYLRRVFTPPSFLGSTGGYDSVAGKASWQSN